VKLDDADEAWDLLASQLETFIAEWEAGGEAPDLSQFLPADPPELRRMALVELIKIDLEYRWQHREMPKRIEQYVDEFAELRDHAGVPSDLIYEEFHVRRMAGEQVNINEFAERFPDKADELERLLPTDAISESTCLFVKKEGEEVEVGQTIDDFHLLCKLGKGAFASVFLARQDSMQRLVALKVSGDKGSEPQTLAQMDHPHIVRVYDQRQLPERGLRLLYMQYVSGGTLQEVVRHVREYPPHERTGALLLEAIDASLSQRGESPPADSRWRMQLAKASWPEVVCHLGAQLAGALDYAHRRGVLHRDVKPANVLITGDATPKLADFNISYSSKVEGTTPAAYFGGSLAYMSPEQLDACNPSHAATPDDLDGRADLYSLGVVLWELLYGQRPFQDDRLNGDWSNTLEAMAATRRAQELYPEEASGRDRFADEMHELLKDCLHPDPEQRCANGAEMAQRLQLCFHPHAKKLLHPPPNSWRRWVRKYPIITGIVAVVFPHILASLLNVYYNFEKIVKQIIPPEEWWNFFLSIIPINVTAYPLAIVVVSYLMWPIGRHVRALALGAPVTDADVRLRRRALRVGHLVALVGIVSWVLTGPAIPGTLELLVGEIPRRLYIYFPVSVLVCGLIATAYPFFHATFLAVQVYYPALIEKTGPRTEDQTALIKLGRSCGIYLLLAGGIPMLTITLLIVSQSIAVSTDSDPVVYLVLSVIGLVGLGVSFWLYRIIQRDLAALISLGQSIEQGIAGSEETAY